MQFTLCGRWHLLSHLAGTFRQLHSTLTLSSHLAASSLFLFALSHLLSSSPSCRVVKIIESHQWHSLRQFGPSSEYHTNTNWIKDGKGKRTLLIQLIGLRQPNLCPLLLLLSLCFSFFSLLRGLCSYLSDLQVFTFLLHSVSFFVCPRSVLATINAKSIAKYVC